MTTSQKRTFFNFIYFYAQRAFTLEKKLKIQVFFFNSACGFTENNTRFRDTDGINILYGPQNSPKWII